MQPPPPAFLDEQAIAQHGAEAGLAAATIQTLRAFARRIAADPQLQFVATAAHHTVFATDTDVADAMETVDTTFGTQAGMLHALYVLDMLRLIRERYAARGVPASMAMGVFEQHGAAGLRDAAARGDIGSAGWSPGWHRIVASGDFYQLGCLEFVRATMQYPQRIYRHVHSGEVVALAEAGEHFSDEGVGVGPQTWSSVLLETQDAIIATPLSPHGIALRRLVRLPRHDWQLVLKPGDPILDLHVPGDEPLTIGALRDAHMQAASFFDRFYPDHPFVAYLCDSWLFSPLLEEMLGPDSNIVRWQREGYLLPDDSEGEDLVELAHAGRDTRLRRALRARLEDGRLLYGGRYLFLRQDLDRFGSQPYREASARAIEQLTIPVP